MTDIKRLSNEISQAMGFYKKIYTAAVKDQRIDESEFKELATDLEWLTQKRAELTLILEIQKNPKLSKEQVLNAIGKALYDKALEKHKKAMEIFEATKEDPSYYMISQWDLMVAQYKLDERGFLALTFVETELYTGTSRAKMNIMIWAQDLKNKEKDFLKAEVELNKIKAILKLKQDTARETDLDNDAIDQLKTIDQISKRFSDLTIRMNSVQGDIFTHFIGWQKTSQAICVTHTMAEKKYQLLMKAQNDETTKEAKLRAIVLNVTLTVGNIVFPGLSTPITTLLTGVLNPILDKKTTEYSEATLKIGTSIKKIEIGKSVESALAAKYVGNISAIAKNFEGVLSTLKLGKSKDTMASNFVPKDAAQSLLKYNLELCTKIHEAAEKVMVLKNICKDIMIRVGRLASYEIFGDKNVDSSACIDSLKKLYKELSPAVNTLEKSINKFAPPKLSKTLIEKPGDNAIFEQFLNVMLLKWLPSTELIKKRIKTHRQRVGASGIKITYYEEMYKDYPTLIAKDVQTAITTYCGIDKSHFTNIPYDWQTDWGTWDSTSDAAIASLIKVAQSKFKGMENPNVWTKALGL